MDIGSSESLRRNLAFAGVIPFVAGASLLVASVKGLPVLGGIDRALSSYTILIFAFMAGVHWGQFLQGIRSDVNLLVESNALAIACWFAYLLMPTAWFYAASTIGFGSLLWTDYNLYRRSEITKSYLQIRSYVTLLVVISLIIAAIYA